MRYLRWLLAVLTGLIALCALAMPTLASASNAAPKQVPYVVQQVNPTTYVSPVVKAVKVSPLIAAYKICTRSGTSRCMTGEGVGYQFQMQASGYSTFSQNAGDFGYVYKTPNGLCPQAKDGANYWVVMGETACGTSNVSYEWDPTSDSPSRLVNQAYGRYLGVLFNNQDGAKTTTQPATGAYYLGPFGS